MWPYPLAKFSWAKLIGFGQIWLDLGKIKTIFRAKVVKLGQK